MTAVTEDTKGAATELPRLLPPPADKNKNAQDWYEIGRASCRERVYLAV